ncbi:MAG: hypothetical protein QW144_03045 [Candidatus Micrarchaeaceae archaeon]
MKNIYIIIKDEQNNIIKEYKVPINDGNDFRIIKEQLEQDISIYLTDFRYKTNLK